MGFYSNGRYRVYTDKERKEYGERMRLERSNKWHKVWITKTGLKEERNWTDWAIKQFLNKPTEFSGKFRTYYAFRRDDVMKAEKKKAFKEWMVKRVERQAKRST